MFNWNKLKEERSLSRYLSATVGEVLSQAGIELVSPEKQVLKVPLFNGGVWVGNIQTGFFDGLESLGTSWEIRFDDAGVKVLCQPRAIRKLDAKRSQLIDLQKELESRLLRLTKIVMSELTQSQNRQGEVSVKGLEVGYERYEYLRTLNPRQFLELYRENLSTGVHFDTLVDLRRKSVA